MRSSNCYINYYASSTGEKMSSKKFLFSIYSGHINMIVVNQRNVYNKYYNHIIFK